jgi:Zn-dependent peptidase ImmA (M78 family)
MGYSYEGFTQDELEAYADVILTRYPDRRIAPFAVDVEGILEDFGITILPRRGGLRALVEGYRPRDVHFIVIPDEYAASPPMYRTIVAEELCHTVLEYKLWMGESLPTGAEGHELSAEQHKRIEADAKYLAGAILLPKEIFISRYEYHRVSFTKVNGKREKVVRASVDELTSEFVTTEHATARRVRDLKFITNEEYKEFFLNKIRM